MTEQETWPADTAPSDRWTIYTRGNVGEVYPNVVVPLEWSTAGLSSENGWRDGATTVGFLTDEDFGDGDFVLIGVFGGYAYFNASLMRLLGVRTPGLAVDVIDTQFLGDAEVPPYQPKSGDKNLKASAKVVATAVATLFARSVPLVDDMRERADAYRAACPPLDAPDEVLWAYIKAGVEELWQAMIAGHVINTMRATIATGALTDFCEKHLGDPNLALDLTTGIGDVVSAEPAREMWALANQTSDEDFDAAFAQFLLRHGHRGPNEFSLAGRDWAAFPEVALAAIDTMRGLDPANAPEAQERRMAAARAAAMSEAKTKLGWRFKQLERSVANAALWSRAREASKNQVIRGNQLSRHVYLELVRRAAERGGVADSDGPLMLTEDEFVAYLADPKSHLSLIAQRRERHQELVSLEPPFAFDAAQHQDGPPPVEHWKPRARTVEPAIAGSTLQGAGGSPGTARGRARVLRDPGDPTALQPGEILIAPITDPSWTPLFVAAAGVVVEVGAAMSHSMIVSRELGIPCVVGVEDATRRIPDGAIVEIDGHNGTVIVV